MPKRYFINYFSDNHENDPKKNDEFWMNKICILEKLISQNVASSKNTLYTGTAGIAFMYYYLSTLEYFKNDCTTYLNKAVEILKHKEDNSNTQKLNQFISGNAGINAIRAAIYQKIGDVKMAEKYLEYFKSGINSCRPINYFETEKDELFVGRAGYLFGILWLEKVFGKKIISDQDVIEICLTIVKSGHKYSKMKESKFPLMYCYHNKKYLGAAHGLSTILQVLISFPQFLKSETKAVLYIKKTIDLLVTLQTDSGNFPTKIEVLGSKQRSEEDELVHWCHGAPGVIYLLAKAYLIFKEPSYLEACLKCGDLVWSKGLLKKGPGICHGIAGNGYVFLLLYRLTGDTKHLHRAKKFGEFIFTDECVQGSRKPDNPYSLYEGLAGTVCYLIDLTQPEKASFPFLDVF